MKNTFNPRQFMFGEPILVRNDYDEKWEKSEFRAYQPDDKAHPIWVPGASYKYAIPFNCCTRHLADTANDCDIHFKWWREPKRDTKVYTAKDFKKFLASTLLRLEDTHDEAIVFHDDASDMNGPFIGMPGEGFIELRNPFK